MSLLDLSTYIAGTFEDMCFAIPLPTGTRTACEIGMESLWARPRNKQTNKRKNSNPKLCFQSAPFLLLPSDLFKIKIKIILNEVYTITNTS